MAKPGFQRRRVLGEAAEDYLKAVFELQAGSGRALTTTLAARLAVSPASVTGMIKKLAALRLLRHVPYQGVRLTRLGERIALEILRHHRLLELYLARTLGYSWDQVHDEACRLEHVISEELEEKMFEALGRPTRDPHGEPIPTRDGTLPVVRDQPLTALEPGVSATIRLVSQSDPEMLRYLGQRGLVPDAALEVIEKAPFDGPITVRMGRSSHALGRRLAEHIRVEVGRRRGS